MISTIKTQIATVVKTICPAVYFNKSADKYPKIDCDLRQLTVSGCKHSFMLTLDFWGNDGISKNIDDLADSAAIALNNVQIDTEIGSIFIYDNGSRFTSSETDNTKITHVTARYEVYFYSKTEE